MTSFLSHNPETNSNEYGYESCCLYYGNHNNNFAIVLCEDLASRKYPNFGKPLRKQSFTMELYSLPCHAFRFEHGIAMSNNTF